MEPPSKKRKVDIVKSESNIPLIILVKLETLEKKLDIILQKLNKISNGNTDLQMNYIS